MHLYERAHRFLSARRGVRAGASVPVAAVLTAVCTLAGGGPAAAVRKASAPPQAKAAATSVKLVTPKRPAAGMALNPHRGGFWLAVLDKATGTPPAAAPASAAARALGATIAAAARSQIGQTNPAVFGGPGGEWCAAFASWVYRSAGLNIGQLTAAYQVGSWAQAGEGTLLPPSATPEVGDAVLFERNGSGEAWPGPGLDISNIAHVNIVSSVNPDGSFTTIGGNERGPGGVHAVREQGPYSASDAPSWWGQTVYGFVKPG